MTRTELIKYINNRLNILIIRKHAANRYQMPFDTHHCGKIQGAIDELNMIKTMLNGEFYR